MTTSTSKPTKAIFLPGNGCDEDEPLDDVMWYGWLAERLRQEPFNLQVQTPGFPDPLYAREHIWKDFAVKQLGLDENTIMIGHSSGAACALRLMEEHKTAGCVLVSAYNDDLGDDLERGSGYFSRPFDYDAMRRNTPWIIQFHSVSDHLVPVRIGRDVAEKLKPSEYVETEKDGHFQRSAYPIMVKAIKKQMGY
eukprot:PhF_6_TR24456/c0_g1_i1/m.33816/K07002/K07002; uncharacterized protein